METCRNDGEEKLKAIMDRVRRDFESTRLGEAAAGRWLQSHRDDDEKEHVFRRLFKHLERLQQLIDAQDPDVAGEFVCALEGDYIGEEWWGRLLKDGYEKANQPGFMRSFLRAVLKSLARYHRYE